MLLSVRQPGRSLWRTPPLHLASLFLMLCSGLLFVVFPFLLWAYFTDRGLAHDPVLLNPVLNPAAMARSALLGATVCAVSGVVLGLGAWRLWRVGSRRSALSQTQELDSASTGAL
jgi:hypothetical protein